MSVGIAVGVDVDLDVDLDVDVDVDVDVGVGGVFSVQSTVHGDLVSCLSVRSFIYIPQLSLRKYR